MYWRQIIVAAWVAVGGGWYAWTTGETLGTTLVIGVLGYLGVRLLLAWIGRTRYWYQHSGYESHTCPTCGLYISRVRRDWILTCHRCGWRPGLPGLRWLTRSVPSRQLQRTVWGIRGLLVLSAAVLFVTGGAAGVTMGSLQALDVAAVPAGDAGDGPGDSGPETVTTVTRHTTTSEVSGIETATERDGLNASAIERAIHREINEVRAERNLSLLSWDASLAEIARYHSRDMIERGYFAHTGPDGETMGDRYEQFGYECRVPKGDGSYATGGENIAYVYASQYDDADAVAARIVDLWMDSRGHRENILREYWENEGIGVRLGTVDGERRVYVTQNFC